jgi:hypothetical protein
MRLRFFAFVLALPLLTSCAGGGSTSGPVLQQSADSMQDTASVSERDALRIAQTSDTSHETLSVQPPSLTLVLPTAQKLTVTVTRKTIVAAASDNPKIATVSPSLAAVKTLVNGSGTATFTVTPRALGKAVIGLVDAQLNYAVVCVMVTKVGPSPSPSPKPTATATPTPSPTATPTPTPSPTATPTPTPVPTPVVTYLTSGTTWQVPADWNPSNNQIEAIGGGGGGGAVDGGGGGGGAYTKVTNLNYTGGAVISIGVGSGGTSGSAGAATYLCPTTAPCSGSGALVLAQGGSPGLAGGGSTVGSGGAGGQATSGPNTISFAGGQGGYGPGGESGGGGGGAGGPIGAGATGGDGAEPPAGGGGGGNGGGSPGHDGEVAEGGNGGNNNANAGGGIGYGGNANGSVGGGGGGGSSFNTSTSGGNGGNGIDINALFGSGGGGGGGASTSGGNGGSYGGGGGGGSPAGNGAGGLIVITYTPTGASPAASRRLPAKTNLRH